MPKKYRELADEPVIVLKRIAYGPAGFRCKCGSAKFVHDARPRHKTGERITSWNASPNYYCYKCKENYIFINYSVANGTTL